MRQRPTLPPHLPYGCSPTAAAVRPDFTVTDDNIAVVTEVCRRLDGLPLAVELAAARLRSMPVEQLAARIEDRFQLLGGGSRTAMPRHRTLRAVVAWSWDLLERGERRSAERLAVFPTSFAAEAAEHMGATSDTLDAFVDKSLLQVVDGPKPRYRMLETIREYGLERLAETGEVVRARAAYAAYFLGLAERAEPHLRGSGQLPWIRALVADRDNLLAAVRVACDSGDADTAVRLGAALWYFWAVHNEHGEAADRLHAVLNVAGDAPGHARVAATAGYLFNAVLSGETADARAAAGQFRALAREQGANHLVVLIEALLALITDEAAQGFAAVEGLLRHPDPWTRAMSWHVRSFLHGSYGDMAEMARGLTAAATSFREAGERWGLAMSLTYLALSQTMLGAFDGAAAALEESMGLAREFGTDDYQRVWLAMVRKHTGDVERARGDLRDVVTDAGPSRYVPMARLVLADLARYDGDLEEATRQLEDAWEGFGDGGLDDAGFLALYRTGMGLLAVAKGELVSAQPYLREALTLAVEMPDMPMAAMVGVGVAQLRLRYGDAVVAAEVLGAAHALRGAPDAYNPDVVWLTRELHGELGERAFQHAYDHGRRLNRADALALIEAQLTDPASRSPKTSRHPLQQKA